MLEPFQGIVTKAPKSPSGSPHPKQIPSTSPNKSSLPTSPISGNSPSSINNPLFCPLCKKKFSNEKTFQTHESSSKHQKLLKESKTIDVSPKSKAKPTNKQAVTSPTSSENNEMLNEALSSITVAKKCRNDQPNKAIKLLVKSGKCMKLKIHI